MRFCIALTLLLMFGCSEQALDRPIEFQLQSGFQGPFVVIEHPSYPDAITVLPDRYELKVPVDGVLRTRDARIFHRWHKPLRLQTGPCSVYGNSGPNTPIVNWFFAGTHEESYAYFHSADSSGKMDNWLASRGIARQSLSGTGAPP